jgi:hypothetical protein
MSCGSRFHALFRRTCRTNRRFWRRKVISQPPEDNPAIVRIARGRRHGRLIGVEVAAAANGHDDVGRNVDACPTLVRRLP